MEQYNKLEDPTDEENDMLDLAFGLTETLVPFAQSIFISSNRDYMLHCFVFPLVFLFWGTN